MYFIQKMAFCKKNPKNKSQMEPAPSASTFSLAQNHLAIPAKYQQYAAYLAMATSPKNTYSIFTDENFDPRSKIGVGCKLVLNTGENSQKIETKDFDETSAARLELETVIWALESFESEVKSPKIILYTDSKTVIGLLERRAKLQKTDFMSAKAGVPLANAELFKDFFALHDRLNFEVASGEEQTSFAEVVKHADKMLKERLKSQNQTADKWF